jgi:prephenate dehydrogenase
MKTVTIVGVGLIGGSFVLGLRKQGFQGRLIGVSSPATLAKALERGAIDEALPLEQAVPQSDLIYLAQPIGRILDILPVVARLAAPSALVTDGGSTKSAIVARAREVFGEGGATFLGGHPMAGKAERGVEAADPELFRGAIYVLTPPDGTLPQTGPVPQFVQWIERLGAQTVVLGPEMHDEIVSLTSHLPQLISTALASLLAEELPSEDFWKVSGGGLRDGVRLARSPYDLWRDICLTNTENISSALSVFIQKLEFLRDNLRDRALEKEFERAAHLVAELQKNSG